MKTELEEFISDNIGAFNSRTPDPAVLERIKQKLQDNNRKKKEKAAVISLRLRWVAAACLIVLAAGVGFLAISKTEEPQTAFVSPQRSQPVAPNTITPTPGVEETESASKIEREAESRQIHLPEADAEEDQRKMLLFARLTNSQSPSERLNAASQIEEITSTDNDIVDALAITMNTDPNTNVRLAALDALSKFYREPYVKKKLLSSLKNQKDPMVQIALIELLTKMKERTILKQLNKMVGDEKTMQAVKDQAYSGILTLSS